MTKVFISAKLNPEGLDVLKAARLHITESEPLNGQALIKALQGYEALIVRSETKVTAEVLKACPKLRVVGRAGTGVDNIDVAAATDAGVIVMNAPGGNTITTAEHTFGLMLSAARMIPQAHKKLVEGIFDRKIKGIELEGKTLGIIGLGQIGRVLARKAVGFGMVVIGYDPYCPADIAHGLNVELLPLDALLARADVVSVHVPKTSETENFINAAAIDRMKPGAILINCARGGLVDEQAVRAALDSGKLGAAAFDVFETEPPPPGHPLVGHPKVVSTPHLGASTEEAQVNVARIVCEQIAAYFQTGAVRGAVNLPAITPQAYAEIQPFVELAHQLGSFVAQASRTDAISAFRISYRGQIAERNTDFVMRSALSVYLRHRADTVNAVNAPDVAKRFGFDVTETREPGHGNGFGHVCVALQSSLGERSIEGVVFDARTMRLTRYDGFHIDAPVHGTMLLTRNDDIPGVVGRVGTCLGNEGINIAGYHLGRRVSGGEAVALIEIDTVPTQAQLDELLSFAKLKSIKLVKL